MSLCRLPHESCHTECKEPRRHLEDTLHVCARAGKDTGAPYLTLRRLAVWVSEPLLRLKTLASLTDALEALPAGKLIAALDAAAQHGDPAVSSTVSSPSCFHHKSQSLTDALEALPAGKLIAALDAAAQHGDPAVSSTVSTL